MNPRLIVIFFAVAVLGLAARREAAACSCVVPPAPQEAMANSAAVFEGTVTEVRGPKEPEFGNVEVVLQVGRRFKAAEADTVTVITSNSSAACGYNFEQGSTYLVYAHQGEDNQLSVSLCSRTARIEDAADDLAALGGGANPTPGPDEPEPAPQPPAVEPGKRGCGGCSTGAPLESAAGGLLLVMAAALALRRRA